MLAVGLAMVLIMRWRPRGLVTKRDPSIYLKEKKAVSGRSRGAGARLRWRLGEWCRMLRVEHLTMRFGGLTAIAICPSPPHATTSPRLIGPNGAGKTTVFNCITGFYKPTEGMIVMHPEDGSEFILERMDDFRIAQRAKVARTFQNIRLFAGMTVLENLVVAQHNTLMRASGYTVAGILGCPGYRRAEKAAVEKAKYWLEKINLIDRADDPAGDLPMAPSAGSRSPAPCAPSPKLLCLDEPAAGLNPRESDELNRLLLAIRKEQQIGILLIEHDMRVVMEISDHIVVLDYGQKIADGTPAEVEMIRR